MFFALALLLTLVAVGLPAAAWLCPADDRHGPAGVFFLAGTIGVIAQVLVGVGLAFLGVYAPITVVLASVVISAVPLASRRGRAGVATMFGSFPARAWVELLPVGLVLAIPKSPVYFLFQTGDMGQYTNEANILADTGEVLSGFPRGFSFLLAATHVLLGESRLDVLLPAIGALFALGAVAVPRALGSSRLAAVVIGSIVALHPVSVWFSLFPVSEAVYAVMVLGLVHLLFLARRETSNELAVLAGLMCGVLLLTRANALVLVGVLAPLLLVSLAVDDPPRARVHARFTVVSVAALLAAYVYNVREIPTYFVENQLQGQLSSSLFATLGRWQLTGLSRVLVLVGVLTVFATWIAGRAVVALSERRGQPWWRAVVASRIVVVAAATLAIINFGTGGLTDALERWGVGLVALVGAGIVVSLIRAKAEADAVVVTGALLIGLAGTVLFAKRIDFARTHDYHLYWDRYLFSEGFPVALVLAALALTMVGRIARVPPWSSVAVVVAGALVVGPVFSQTVEELEHPFLGDPYEALAEIADDIDDGAAVYYASTPEKPAGWFFPNTYRAYAVPLAQTFNREVRGLPSGAFATDPSPELSEVVERLRSADRRTGYILVARTRDEAFSYTGPGVELVESVEHTTWILPRRLDPADEEFRRIDVLLELYRIDVGAAVTS